MSRHIFTMNGIRTVVGWDPPLRTFYIQRGVGDTEGFWAEGPWLWLGTNYQEITDIQEVVELNREYKFGFTDTLIWALHEDQDNNL